MTKRSHPELISHCHPGGAPACNAVTLRAGSTTRDPGGKDIKIKKK